MIFFFFYMFCFHDLLYWIMFTWILLNNYIHSMLFCVSRFFYRAMILSWIIMMALCIIRVLIIYLCTSEIPWYITLIKVRVVNICHVLDYFTWLLNCQISWMDATGSREQVLYHNLLIFRFASMIMLLSYYIYNY